MRISDWSSDVCSSDLAEGLLEQTRDASSGATVIGTVEVRWLDGDTLHVATTEARAGGGAYVVGRGDDIAEIGRASCRERVCQYVSISVVAVSLKKKNSTDRRATKVTKNSSQTQ